MQDLLDLYGWPLSYSQEHILAYINKQYGGIEEANKPAAGIWGNKRITLSPGMIFGLLRVGVKDDIDRPLLTRGEIYKVPGAAEAAIEGGCDINKPSMTGVKPVEVAIQYPEILKQLINLGVDVNKKDSVGFTPIVQAVADEKCESIYLLSLGLADIDFQMHGSMSLIHFCAHTGRVRAFATLMALGADLAICDEDGQNTYHALAQTGSIEMLMMAGLSSSRSQGANKKDNQGKTPLHIAVKRGNFLVVKVMVDRLYVDASIKDDQGITPLELSASTGRFDLFQQMYLSILTRESLKPGLRAIAQAAGHSFIVEYLDSKGQN